MTEWERGIGKGKSWKWLKSETVWCGKCKDVTFAEHIVATKEHYGEDFMVKCKETKNRYITYARRTKRPEGYSE